MLFRGQRLRFKCDGLTRSLLVDEICLSREGTDERTKEKKRKEEKCLHARNQKKRHRRDRQILSNSGKKPGRAISVLETKTKTYHELFGDSFRSHFVLFLSAIFFCMCLERDVMTNVFNTQLFQNLACSFSLCLAKSIRSGFKRLRREVVSFCANLFLKSRVLSLSLLLCKVRLFVARLAKSQCFLFLWRQRKKRGQIKKYTKQTRKSTHTKILPRNQSINQRSS